MGGVTTTYGPFSMGAAVDIGDGTVAITFSSLAGHALGAQWTLTSSGITPPTYRFVQCAV
ncbi:MAG: hypothetical protein EOO65_01390 [Methanosarcinales archaeon]|nr:MAG: hypothetical protein EOO65_01390 [Methanosarcinales archaeon]